MNLQITQPSPAYWRVTLDNPPLNLMSPELIDELRPLMEAMEASQELKVVVFDSANPDYFMAHYDLLRAGESSKELGPTGLQPLNDFCQRLAVLPVVSIASIRGRTRGVGSELAMAMDMRFASREKAILCQPEVGCGVFPGGGGAERLPLLVGRARALEIIVSSLDYDADTAELYGWVNRAIPDADLDGFVDGFARRIATFEKRSLGMAKRLVNRSSPMVDGGYLEASLGTFNLALTWPETQARVGRALQRGFQQEGDFEMNLGARLGEL